MRHKKNGGPEGPPLRKHPARAQALLGWLAAGSGTTLEASPIFMQMKYTTAPTMNAATGAAGTV